MEKTTIQLSDSLRRRLKVAASSRGIDYEELLEDLLDCFDAFFPFRTEEEFERFFESNLERFGFRRVVHKSLASSPDYLVEDLKGETKRVELELYAKDFERHRHPPSKVDSIVALFSTQDQVQGVPVISLLQPDTLKAVLLKELSGRFSTVSIPRTLHNSLLQAIEKTGFTSVSEYVTFVLREIISKEAEEKTHEPYTAEEVEEIKKRLKALGYL